MVDLNIMFSDSVVAEGDAISPGWGLCSHWADETNTWDMTKEMQYVCGEYGETCRVTLYERTRPGVPVVDSLEWRDEGARGAGNVIVVQASLGDGGARSVHDMGTCYHSTSLLEPASLWETFLRTEGEGYSGWQDAGATQSKYVMVGKSLVFSWDRDMVVSQRAISNGLVCGEKMLRGVVNSDEAFMGVRECYNVDDGEGRGAVRVLLKGRLPGTYWLVDRDYEFDTRSYGNQWSLKSEDRDLYETDVGYRDLAGNCEKFITYSRGESFGDLVGCISQSRGSHVPLSDMVSSGGRVKHISGLVCTYEGGTPKCSLRGRRSGGDGVGTE